MSVFWKKSEFYKEKSGDRNRNWGLDQNPGVVSGRHGPNIFNVFKAIKPLTMALKKTIFMVEEVTLVHNQPIFPGQT